MRTKARAGERNREGTNRGERENLLNELRPLRHQIVVDGGKRLFQGDTGQAPPQLVDSQTVDSRAHDLTRVPAD